MLSKDRFQKQCTLESFVHELIWFYHEWRRILDRGQKRVTDVIMRLTKRYPGMKEHSGSRPETTYRRYSKYLKSCLCSRRRLELHSSSPSRGEYISICRACTVGSIIVCSCRKCPIQSQGDFPVIFRRFYLSYWAKTSTISRELTHFHLLRHYVGPDLAQDRYCEEVSRAAINVKAWDFWNPKLQEKDSHSCCR